MMINKNILYFNSIISKNVKLIAVSKTQPIEYIQEAYNGGQRVFGENKVQELNSKYEALPKDIEWHFIGHLQSNKVKYIAPFVNLIHSVDSLSILEEINRQATKNDRTIACLIQFHIAMEETKFGFSLDEAVELLNSEAFKALNNIEIIGVMGMATYTDDNNHIRKEFKCLKSIFNHLKSEYFTDKASFKEISMGMSGDFEIAIEEGSTMVRIGSSIFGER
ncbi:MAG: YggS family pyridoxal phosphate-dependent enzyme [Bacteroidota bacterium]